MTGRLSVKAAWDPLSHGVDDWSLDSGIGLEKLEGTHGWERYTGGAVLRKIKINPTGEGTTFINQKAEIEVTGYLSSCEAVAPVLGIVVDERDVSINSVFGTWPNSPVPDGTKLDQFEHSQDNWPYYSDYIEARYFQWNKSKSESAPLSFPSDSTDFSEWHIGLFTTKHVVQNPYSIPPSYLETALVGGVTLAVVGDSFEWRVASNEWRTGDPVGPYPNPRSGTYDGIPINAWAQYTAYVPAQAVVVATSLFKVAHDPGQTDTATFTWLWQDGLKGQSIRSIKVHENREPDGQKSDAWRECNVGGDYEGLPTEYQNLSSVPDIEGFIDRGVTQCTLGDVGVQLEGIGAVLSASGPFVGGVLVGLGVVSGGTLVTAFAAVEAAGALISCIPTTSDSFNFQRDTYKNIQVDAITIEGDWFNLTVNGVYYPAVSSADYTNPPLLAALKAAIDGRIADYYWRVDVRKVADVEYEVFNLWDEHGFRSQEVVPRPKEISPASGYFRMTFKRV